MANETNLRVFRDQVFNDVPEYLQGDDTKSSISGLSDIYAPFLDMIEPLFKNERCATECTQESLDLLAQEGSLKRLDTEPLESFRVRVDEKFLNQIISGTFSGFARILELFGIVDGKEAIEFVGGSLWDFIFITDEAYAQSTIPPDVLRELAGTKWGRTGRIFNGVLELPIFQFDLDAVPDPNAAGFEEGILLTYSFGDAPTPSYKQQMFITPIFQFDLNLNPDPDGAGFDTGTLKTIKSP